MIDILTRDDCLKINEVVDYIIANRHTDKVTVGMVKEKFGLYDMEYQMISELMMPAMRQSAEADKWHLRHSQKVGNINAAIRALGDCIRSLGVKKPDKKDILRLVTVALSCLQKKEDEEEDAA